jgi:hypothetical protein
MNTIKNITVWETKFNTYCDYEKKCIECMTSILEIKNNLTKLLGNQKKDDIIFYKSVIDNSHFYLSSSLKIRKLKLIKDLDLIWKQINTSKEMADLSKSNFMALLKDYEKMSKDIFFARENNTSLSWVKNDKVESLEMIEHDMNEAMDYHINMIDYLYSMCDLEKTFFCNPKN